MHINKDRVKRLSKFLSLILRHQPEKISIELDENGWANVKTLLLQMNKHKKTINMEILEFVIDNNDKKRFSFNEDKTKIRASQGHSININLGYQIQSADTVPAILYHGTAESFAKKITQSGSIQKMNRHHVHLSADIETASKVGRRHGKLVVFSIDTHSMIADGCDFYQSENGVWLTDEVAVKYMTTLDISNNH